MNLNATIKLEPHQFLDILKSLEPWRFTQVVREFAPAYAQEQARQEALSKTYKVNQELFERMQMSETTVYKAIQTKRLRATPIGDSKSYRVTEQAIREFFGDIKEGNYAS